MTVEGAVPVPGALVEGLRGEGSLSNPYSVELFAARAPGGGGRPTGQTQMT